jgi:hypothetical protein
LIRPPGGPCGGALLREPERLEVYRRSSLQKTAGQRIASNQLLIRRSGSSAWRSTFRVDRSPRNDHGSSYYGVIDELLRCDRRAADYESAGHVHRHLLSPTRVGRDMLTAYPWPAPSGSCNRALRRACLPLATRPLSCRLAAPADDGQPSSINWLNTAFWAEQSKHRLQLARGTYAERRASKMALSNIRSIRETAADQGF